VDNLPTNFLHSELQMAERYTFLHNRLLTQVQVTSADNLKEKLYAILHILIVIKAESF
jgi:hypothetical protein